MAAVLGNLALIINSSGIAKATKGMKQLHKRMGGFAKKMGPAFKKMSKTMSKFGTVATGAFFALAAASPLLRARLEILQLRVSELLRVFGDELAPIIEDVTDLVETATDIWKGLPGPMQESILFGVKVAAVIGVVAIAFMILSAAMSPVTIAILAIVVAAALLHFAWTTNLFGIRDVTKDVIEFITGLIQGIITYFESIETALASVGITWELIFDAIEIYVGLWVGFIQAYIQAVLDTFQGVVDFLTAIFKGDIEEALKAVKGIFDTQLGFMADAIQLPLTALQDFMDLLAGAEFLKKMEDAGKAIIAAFIKGIVDALAAGIDAVEKGVNEIKKLWGGSLPEKGPLVGVPQMGQELGAAYITGIVSGMQGAGASTTFNRTFNIENVALEVPGATESDSRGFMGRLDTGIRRATF